MKKYIFLSLLCAIMCACSMDNVYSTIENTPTNPGIAQPIYKEANASFSTRGYKGGLTVPFTDYSTGIYFVYDFGDGTIKEFKTGDLQKLTPDEQKFTHTYKTKKTYTVTVMAYGKGGDQDKKTEELVLW